MSLRKGGSPKTIAATLTVTGQGSSDKINVTYHNRKTSEIKQRFSDQSSLASTIPFLVESWDSDFEITEEGVLAYEDEYPGIVDILLEGFQQGSPKGPGKKLMAATEALYWKAPTEAELAGTGLKPKHYKSPEVAVQDENWPAIQMFTRFNTQWRMGMAGPVGLDFSVIQNDHQFRSMTDEERDDLMDRMNIIESAALDHFHRK